MPRSTPLVFRQISYAESAGDGIIQLVEINHPSFGSPPEPVRLARNPKDVVSNGETYIAFAFEILPPEVRADGGFVQSHMRIDAVNLQIIEILRNLTTPASLVHFTVLISDPDAVQQGPWTYSIRGEQQYSRQELDLLLTFDPVMEEQLPWKKLSPSRAPGLF